MKEHIVIFLMGPSGIGKTSLSLKIHALFNIEIINIDSVMMYKNMTIGTGKPDKKKLKKIKHNLTNNLNIHETYSVFNFCIDAFFIIRKAISKKKIPLIIGGNMMYIWFFQKYFFEEYFCKNTQYKFLNIVIIPSNKKTINFYIKKRFLYMLKNGIINEVDNIYKNKKLNLKYKSINSIGYKDIWLYLQNKNKFYKLKPLILTSTTNLAKRQKTWLKKWNNNLYYFESKNKNIINDISNLIKKYSLGESSDKY